MYKHPLHTGLKSTTHHKLKKYLRKHSKKCQQIEPPKSHTHKNTKANKPKEDGPSERPFESSQHYDRDFSHSYNVGFIRTKLDRQFPKE